jgi:hypothetical protein
MYFSILFADNRGTGDSAQLLILVQAVNDKCNVITKSMKGTTGDNLYEMHTALLE